MRQTHTHTHTQIHTQTHKCSLLHIKHHCRVTTTLSCFFFLRPLARFVLKGFAKDGRDLTDKETKAFLSAADKDGDGKIGVDGKHQILLVGASRGHTSRQHECRERESDKRRQSVFTCCRLRFTTYSFTGCLLRLQPHCGFTLF